LNEARVQTVRREQPLDDSLFNGELVALIERLQGAAATALVGREPLTEMSAPGLNPHGGSFGEFNDSRVDSAFAALLDFGAKHVSRHGFPHAHAVGTVVVLRTDQGANTPHAQAFQVEFFD
jgi:hypothetical protein